MIKNFRIYIGLILILTQIHCAGLTPKPNLNKIPEVRILLGEQKNIQLSFSGRFQIESNKDKITLHRNKPINFQVATDEIVGKKDLDGNTYLLKSNVIFKAANSNQTVTYLDHSYPGSIHLLVSGNKIKIINKVDLETYVKGVVEQEIGILAKTELEALKAQAITARTYGLKKIRQRNVNSRFFDVRADVLDQVYSGFPKKGKDWIRVAVKETSGEVIIYDNELIDCYYHSTCGGRTESGENIFALTNTPYLQGIADNFGSGDFCKSSPSYRWTESFSFSEIIPSLITIMKQTGNHGGKPDKITKLDILQRFPSGRVKNLALFLNEGQRVVNIDSGSIRNLFRNSKNQLLRSNIFKIEKSIKENIVLIGAGNGHGVGMCQWGAIGMAKTGYTYSQIIMHYYRGTQTKKMY